jgi:hypothetical protein
MFGWFKNKNKKSAVARSAGEVKQKRGGKDLLITIDKLQQEVDRLKLLLGEKSGQLPAVDSALVQPTMGAVVIKNGQEKIVEGIFNGIAMAGNDGKQYDVPANYASKSKLVEGDSLKLTITNTGSFIFKQIKPVERERYLGILEQDSRDLQYYAKREGRRWKLITASVTYFKGQPGDEVVFLTPKNKDSQWAAVENILNK